MGSTPTNNEVTPILPSAKINEFSLMPIDLNHTPQTQPDLKIPIEKVEMQPFQCMMEAEYEHLLTQSEEQLSMKSFVLKKAGSLISRKKFFRAEEHLQSYISNSIKLTIALGTKNYEQLEIVNEECKHSCIMTQTIKNPQHLDKEYFMKNPQKRVDFLIFVAKIISRVNNIYVEPSFVVQSENTYYLLNFQTREISSEELLFKYIIWLYVSSLPFDKISVSTDLIFHGIPLYLYEILHRIQQNQFKVNPSFVEELVKIKEKLQYFVGKTDSFYACFYYKKVSMFLSSKQWIFLKKFNELYFFHVKDEHVCHGKVIRKKRKIDLNINHLIFDPEELQILYIPENTKLVVRANQFQMEQPSTISDIEIKYKLPVKMKNPHILMQSNGDILILEQMLYKYTPSANKLYQLSKKINDLIFLSEYRQSSYLIIKVSVDIFKNGIRVFYQDEDYVLVATGNEALLTEMATIRVDIRSVNFCIEVYKGVFLMMATQNIWILDINFGCFFSYGSYSRIKEMFGITKTNKKIDYAFEILNQPFKVDFLPHQDGRNLTLGPNRLHILGQISGKPYYLKYKFIPRIGALELLGYKPLFVDEHFKVLPPYNEVKVSQTKEYRFNFHEENSSLYKYSQWVFSGPLLLKVYNFKIQWCKTNYQAILSIEPINQNLKDYIEHLKKDKKTLNKIDTLIILHKILTIYEYLIKNSINHRNISVSNIYFTKNRQVKLTGWSQPPRNWHVSDFKDYLLTCFNVITYNSVEKFSQKLLKKHEHELSLYPGLHQKIVNCVKHLKTIETTTEIDKNITSIKEYIEKELCPEFQNKKKNTFIFCFQYKTPRFNMMNTRTQKIKKMCIIVEDSIAQEFIFNSTDKYEWNEEEGYLYIFTATYQFYEVKINTEDMSQEKLTLEDYQYLPKNITDSTFFYLHGSGLYSFGGVEKQSNGNPIFCKSIYKFNRKLLTWEIIGQLPEPRINPQVVLSSCREKIYLFGGLIDHEFPHLKLIEFDYKSMGIEVLVDKSIENPTYVFEQNSCYKVYHISKQLHLFMLWCMEDGFYIIRYFSCLQNGFDGTIRVKNFSTDNSLSSCSITIEDNFIHILRQYGKYTKINIHKLESATVKSETIYSL